MENAEFVNRVCEVVDPTGLLSLVKIVKLVEEKFTAERSKGLGTANRQSMPVICPSCKSDVHVNYKCNNCDYTFTKW
jgi:hypothetical protein